jgi:uncharacterized 2Fe-2S/4Fe-4S cluster protein (DUF4445 family)
MKVIFPNLQKTLDVPEGTLVSDACEQVGHPLDLVCGGNGTCDKCRVDIVEHGMRRSVLGCQHRISADMSILVSSNDENYKLLETTGERAYELHPRIRATRLTVDELAAPMGGYDFDCIAQSIEQRAGICIDVPTQDVLVKISDLLHGGHCTELYAITDGTRLIDIVGSNAYTGIYGVAVDIGTTSCVAFLYDLETGTLLGHCAQLNKQCKYGADVISRIEHTEQDGGLAAEQAAIFETINDLIAKLCNQKRVDAAAIYEVVYCGNSTMQHLFCGFSPAPLGRSPFLGLIDREVTLQAHDTTIPIHSNGIHRFMPLLGGFVGADTVACMLELPDDGKVRMMIDLGTNCEVSIGTPEHFLVASTACGPALEGAGLSMGMRATDGAIESVRFDKDTGRFVIGTIGDVAPAGFCGSGIIDLIAVLLDIGIINHKGAFIKGKKCDSHPLGGRIQQTEDSRRFVLVPAQEHPDGIEISITLKDIRAIQLAKSAICTGYILLRETYGIEPEDIYEICLAGAFGNYIDIECAKSIGLLPDIEGVPIRSLGNGAGLGVQRYLLSSDERDRADAIRMHTEHIELASNELFMETYLKGMAFERNAMKHTR